MKNYLDNWEANSLDLCGLRGERSIAYYAFVVGEWIALPEGSGGRNTIWSPQYERVVEQMWNGLSDREKNLIAAYVEDDIMDDSSGRAPIEDERVENLREYFSGINRKRVPKDIRDFIAVIEKCDAHLRSQFNDDFRQCVMFLR